MPARLVERTILEVALPECQFRLSVTGTEASVKDREVLIKALTRTQEFLENVLMPRAELEERWRLEDEASCVPMPKENQDA